MAAGGVVAANVTPRHDWDNPPTSAAVLGAAAASLVLLAVAEVAQRRIVAGRQPAPDLVSVSVDDAMRSDSVHHLSAAVVAVSLTLSHPVATRIYTADLADPVNWLASFAMLGAPLLGIPAYVWIANRHWHVSRQAPGSAG